VVGVSQEHPIMPKLLLLHSPLDFVTYY
jgi:hypothetical protein